MTDYKILRLPHGYFRGGGVQDIAPSLTISSFEFNNYIIEYGMDNDSGQQATQPT